MNPSNPNSGGNCQASCISALLRQLRHTFSPQFSRPGRNRRRYLDENDHVGCPESSNGYRKTANLALLCQLLAARSLVEAAICPLKPTG